MGEFDRLVDEFFAYWWRANPEHATEAGRHAYDGDLTRYDEAARADRVRHYRDFLGFFEAHSPATVRESIDRALLCGRLRAELDELEHARTFTRDPTLYLRGPLHALFLTALREDSPAEDRARRAAERLAGLPAVLEDARENVTVPAPSAEVGRRDGPTAAAPALTTAAVRLARAGLTLLRGPLPLALGTALEDDPAEYGRWENARRTAEDALVDFADWLEHELSPRAGGGFALGRASYEARLRHLHGLGDSADDLMAYGQALKRDVEKALEAAAREVDAARAWPEVVEALKDEHPPADELIDAYERAMNDARDFVIAEDLVGIPAGDELEVTATPEFLRPMIPFAMYQPPAPDARDDRGFFFVTPAADGDDRLRDHSRHGIPVTALHEAYPGHHLQLVRANRADTLPRQVFRTPVLVEGWALYCEELMGERGFYEDPRQRVLQLHALLWRACRVIVDVGLHVRGWTTGRAVEYLARSAGLARENARAEVRRYCAEPTQPMSYAVGRRELLRLRERYREREGDRFDARSFHDRLLSWGSIPPSLIGRGMGLFGIGRPV